MIKLIHRQIDRFQLSFGFSIPCHHDIHIIQFYKKNLLLCLKSVAEACACIITILSMTWHWIHKSTSLQGVSYKLFPPWTEFFIYFLSQQIPMWFIFLVTNIVMYVLQYIPWIVHYMIPAVPVKTTRKIWINSIKGSYYNHSKTEHNKTSWMWYIYYLWKLQWFHLWFHLWILILLPFYAIYFPQVANFFSTRQYKTELAQDMYKHAWLNCYVLNCTEVAVGMVIRCHLK